MGPMLAPGTLLSGLCIIFNGDVNEIDNRFWWLYRSTLVEVIKTISSTNWPLGSGITGPYKWTGNHTYLGTKMRQAIQKWSSNCVRVYSVLHSLLRNYISLFIKKIFLVYHYQILAILYPTSLANLVVGVGTRYSHQILLSSVCGVPNRDWYQDVCAIVTAWHL